MEIIHSLTFNSHYTKYLVKLKNLNLEIINQNHSGFNDDDNNDTKIYEFGDSVDKIVMSESLKNM